MRRRVTSSAISPIRVKAANRFDTRRGASFGAFAEPTIEGELRHHLRDQSGTVRVPRELQRLGKRLQSQQAELAASLGRAPTLSELADAVDADTKEVERALAAELAREPLSLPHADDDSETTGASEPYADSDDRLLLSERMRVLDERERQIVLLRFHGDMTERQIAEEVGISQAHVSRLLAGALTKLRTELAEEKTPGKTRDTTAPAVVSPPAEAPDAPNVGSTAAIEPDKPTAKPAASYSGRFLVRMSGDLHQQLAQAAEREQVSLNRFVTDTLANSLNDESAAQPVAAPTQLPDAPAPDRSEGNEPAGARRGHQGRALRMVLAANVLVMILAGAVAVVLLVLALKQGL